MEKVYSIRTKAISWFGQKAPFMFANLPNILTLFRIGVIPLVVGAFFLQQPLASWISASLFLIAGITDYLDGYLARALKSTTNFGRFLDPVADKLLISSVLLLLAGFGRIEGLSLIPALIILCREILVSGLREFLAGLQVSLPVTKLAKWKTLVQMFSLGFLLWGEPFPSLITLTPFALTGLWAAAFLTLITGYDYLKKSLKHMDDDIQH